MEIVRAADIGQPVRRPTSQKPHPRWEMRLSLSSQSEMIQSTVGPYNEAVDGHLRL